MYDRLYNLTQSTTTTNINAFDEFSMMKSQEFHDYSIESKQIDQISLSHENVMTDQSHNEMSETKKYCENIIVPKDYTDDFSCVTVETKEFKHLKQNHSKLKNNKFQRDFYAPPGKLGILLGKNDCDKNTVHKIISSSPLEGILFTGDKIIAIDDIDLENKTCQEIIEIMNESMMKKCKITFVPGCSCS